MSTVAISAKPHWPSFRLLGARVDAVQIPEVVAQIERGGGERRRGVALAGRVYGPELFDAVCAATAGRGYRHFFFGGTDETLSRLQERLHANYPGMVICGAIAPPFRPLTSEEDRATVAAINAARPDILWVGLGCPKQEFWMHAHRDALELPVMVGVGQAFDLYAAMKPPAPRWMRENGLEWLFRFRQEPRRLWRRYLVHAPLFVGNVLMEEIGVRRYNE